ncbi:MAG: hypothetical protein NTY63_02920 [Candidatus Bipolaricaulota bacterium]|nr:hypothetical protein [Candidatus Bipolaricaulota bacterium]
MKRVRVGVALVAVLCLAVGIAEAQNVEAAGVSASALEVNLSDGRTLGIGIQAEFPWGGLISARYWLSPEIGAEGVVLVTGSLGWFEGTATLRALFRVVDASTVDFYVAAGATLPFPLYSGSEVVFAGVGGIEFNFRSAPNLAWNIEFGVACSTLGNVNMVVGTGVHFYF